MGVCDFGRSYSSFLGYKFFSLSLTVFGKRIFDLCKSCFVGGAFALLEGVVRVGVIDPSCVFA